MDFKGIRISIIILSAFLALGLFMFGYSLWSESQYEQPLNEYLEENEQVKEFEILEDDKKDSYYIEIELVYHPHLNFTLVEIENEINEILEDRKWELELKNRPTNDLKNIFYKIHFVLYEAKEQGNFSEMKDEIDLVMEKYDVDHYQVHVQDSSRLIVQMKNEEGFLIHDLDASTSDQDQGSA